MTKELDIESLVLQVVSQMEQQQTVAESTDLEYPDMLQSRKVYERKSRGTKYTSMDEYKPLLQPMHIGQVEIKNRFVMPAMGSNFADAKGYVTQQMIDYYTERAKGGFGLCVVEVSAIHPAGKAINREVGIWKDDFIAGWKKLVDSVHDNGAKIFIQLHHCGRQTTPETNGGYTPVAPSPISCPLNRSLPHELTTEEVYEIIDLFAQGARRAKLAGADGIELNGAHGYILAQFMSPYSNKRIDEFGGDFQSRMRFPVEIVRAIREQVGSDFPISFRFSGEDHWPGGRDLMESQMIARYMEKNGVDCLSISNGTYASLHWMSSPPSKAPGYNSYAAEAIKKVVSIPVITAGRIVDPDVAKEIILQERADFVALGRTSIADPAFPNKVAMNMAEDINPCISCLQGCLEGIFSGGNLSCLANPCTGREGEIDLSLCKTPKKVLVVGAGPAGLSAAWMAAKRGHKVVLYEKKEQLGGQLRLAAVPPTKQDITTLIKYYAHQCDKYGVDLRLGCDFTSDEVERERADVVVLSTGGEPLIPSIPGIENPQFKNAVDVLDGKTYFGDNVLVVGGGMVGAETADFISDQGAKVSVIEFKPSIAGDVQMFVRDALMERFEAKNVKSYPGAKVTQFHDDGVSYESVNTGEAGELRGFDTVVLAMGSKSYNPLEAALKDKVTVHVIGDAKKAGKAITGISEAAGIQAMI